MRADWTPEAETRVRETYPRMVACPAPDVHVVTLDDEKVLYLPADETLQHLDRIAALVWDCLEPPAPVADIALDLAEAFGADQTAVTADVLALLDHLRSAGALRDVAEIPRDA